MSKIIEVQDILSNARACIDCVCEAAKSNAIATVADIASDKIKEADVLLEEYRASIGEGPFSAAPSDTERED